MGIKSISTPRPWQSVGSRRARRARTQSGEMNCGPCEGCSESKSRSRPLFSPANAGHRSLLRGLLALWRGLGRRRGLGSRLTRICCGMLAGLRWRIRAMIRGPCRRTSVTRTSSTPCGTPSFRRGDSRTSGDRKGERDAGASGWLRASEQTGRAPDRLAMGRHKRSWWA